MNPGVLYLDNFRESHNGNQETITDMATNHNGADNSPPVTITTSKSEVKLVRDGEASATYMLLFAII